jgi:hypothetical protein
LAQASALEWEKRQEGEPTEYLNNLTAWWRLTARFTQLKAELSELNQTEER